MNNLDKDKIAKLTILGGLAYGAVSLLKGTPATGVQPGQGNGDPEPGGGSGGSSTPNTGSDYVGSNGSKNGSGYTDTSSQISTNPAHWQVQGKVLGKRHIVAGLVDLGGEAAMLLQKTQKINGVWSNAGDVLFSKDLRNWYEKSPNPVLFKAMPWAGSNNGVPYRIGPRTLFKWNGKYYTYTRDRLGSYPGIRGVGVFSSNNVVNWKGYNKWFLDAQMVQNRVPRKYLSGRDYERCYLKCATVGPNNRIYIIVNIEDTAGKDATFVFKGTDPLDFGTFEFIKAPWHNGGRLVDNLYYINGDWIQIGRGDPGYNSIGLKRGWKPFDTPNGFPISHDGPRETIFPFYFRNQWHLLYDDNKDGRNIHLASQIK